MFVSSMQESFKAVNGGQDIESYQTMLGTMSMFFSCSANCKNYNEDHELFSRDFMISNRMYRR